MVARLERFSRPSGSGAARRMVGLQPLVAGALLISLAISLAAGIDRTWALPEPAPPHSAPAVALTASPTTTRSTVTPAPTPTLHREWETMAATVDGSTVTVDLRFYAGVDVQVAREEADPDEIAWSGDGVLRHTFCAAEPGTREIAISEVMSFTETLEVRVPLTRRESAALVRSQI